MRGLFLATLASTHAHGVVVGSSALDNVQLHSGRQQAARRANADEVKLPDAEQMEAHEDAVDAEAVAAKTIGIDQGTLCEHDSIACDKGKSKGKKKSELKSEKKSEKKLDAVGMVTKIAADVKQLHKDLKYAKESVTILNKAVFSKNANSTALPAKPLPVAAAKFAKGTRVGIAGVIESDSDSAEVLKEGERGRVVDVDSGDGAVLVRLDNSTDEEWVDPDDFDKLMVLEAVTAKPPPPAPPAKTSATATTTVGKIQLAAKATQAPPQRGQTHLRASSRTAAPGSLSSTAVAQSKAPSEQRTAQPVVQQADKQTADQHDDRLANQPVQQQVVQQAVQQAVQEPPAGDGPGSDGDSEELQPPEDAGENLLSQVATGGEVSE